MLFLLFGIQVPSVLVMEEEKAQSTHKLTEMQLATGDSVMP